MASNFSEEDDTQWLRDILAECQLEQFYASIKDELQISRLSHFDYVHADDLLKVGMSKPRARQLLDVVKRKKTHQWRKNIIAKLIGKQHSSSSSSKGENSKSTVSKNSNDSFENNFTCLIHEKDLKLLDKLGDGSFGVVKRGEWTKSKENSMEVAVKILKVDTQTPHSFEDFFKEVQSMHALHHPNLIQLFGIVLSQPMMMVTELAENGALLDYLRKHTRNISLSLLWNFIVQISTGMAYLESKRFLHRDLACRNVLIAKGNKIKIADFGLMRALPQQDEIYVMTEPKKVPFPWCAPESLRYKQFSHASDVWMFGVTCWEIYSFGEDPWIGLNGSQILKKIDKEGERLAKPEACSYAIYQLLLSCWHKVPTARPTFVHVKEIIINHAPKLMRIVTPWIGSNTRFERNDIIAVIDEEAGNIVKGQNQRTYDIVTFPRDILEKTQVNVAKSANNSFIKSHSSLTFNNQQGTNSLSREKSLPLNKQFSYHKFKNERGGVNLDDKKHNNHDSRNKPSPARPPAPRLEPRNGILIDLSPEEMNSLDSSINKAKDTSQNLTTCILDLPIPGTTEEFYTHEAEISNLQIHDTIQENVYQNQNSKYYAESPYRHTYDIAHGSENVYNNEDVFSTQHIDPIINNTNMTSIPNNYAVYGDNFYDSVYSSAIYDTANNYSQPPPTGIYGQTPRQLSEQQINRRMTANTYNNVKSVTEQMMDVLKHEQVTLEEANVAHEKSNGSLDDAIKVFKVRRLESLGVGNTFQCEDALKKSNWDLQNAATYLLNNY